MKLKISCIAILIALAFFSCSSDDSNGSGKNEIVYDATLALAVNHDTQATTKAEGDGSTVTNGNDFIQKLSIAVFQNDVLVQYKDTTSTAGVYEIREVKVPAGVVKVVLFANANIISGTVGTTTYADFINQKLSLSNEINGSLAMTSGVIDETLRAGHNYIGYASTTGSISVDHNGTAIPGYELTGSKISMYRYISQVELTKIILDPSDLYKADITAASFEVDSLFFASVKSSANIVATSNSYEDASAAFWNGAYSSVAGSMKADVAGTDKSFLLYDFTQNWTTAALQSLYSFDNKLRFTSTRAIDKNITLSWTGTAVSKSATDEFLGSYAYVYENTNTTSPTLLVVKGKYSYTLKAGGATITLPNRYYAVIVNDPASTNREYSGTTKHDYIQHNNIYKIQLTIAGPGSDKPFDPTPSAAINAKVTVEKWKVVNMTPDVD